MKKNILKDFIFDLYEMFPNAVLGYDGFVILDDFLEKSNIVHLNNSIEKNFSNNITNFQKLIIKKIFHLLPKVRTFLSGVYKDESNFYKNISVLKDEFSKDVSKDKFYSFEKRFINKNILEFKWLLNLYFYPYKLFEKLIYKNNFNSDDIELIMALDKNDFCEDLLELIFSKKLNLKSKKIVLDNLIDTNDKDRIDKYKSLVNIIENEREYNLIPNEIIERIIEEIVVSNCSDRDFFEKINNFNKNNKKIAFMILSKLHQIDNNKEYLFDSLKESNIDNTIVIIKLLFNINLEFKDLKKIFKYVFDSRKNDKDEYVISRETSFLFSIYFIKNSDFLDLFKPIFAKYLKKSNDIKDEIFSHFVTLLNISLKESDTEKLISNVLNSIEDENIKEIVTKKIMSHFLYCNTVINDSIISKSEFNMG